MVLNYLILGKYNNIVKTLLNGHGFMVITHNAHLADKISCKIFYKFSFCNAFKL